MNFEYFQNTQILCMKKVAFLIVSLLLLLSCVGEDLVND